MMRIILINLCVLCFLACNSGGKIASEDTSNSIGNNNKEVYSSETNSLLPLDTTVKSTLIESTNIEELRQIISEFETTSSHQQVNKYTSQVEAQLVELKKQLEPPFNTIAIRSRLEQLESVNAYIDYTLSRTEKDTLLVHKGISELVLAYNSLIIQFNEAGYDIPEHIKENISSSKKPSGVEPLF